MEQKHYPHLGETVFRDRLENGLDIVIVPRPGFQKKLCYFVTDYGAIHTDFTLDGQAVRSPAGVAHYLEHKLFDMPGRDITAEFAALGAVPNAFTGYDMTAYYFSCTEGFDACLDLLLEFVTTPYFTEQSVEKEQGIIGQEIDMNLDNPDTRIFELLMQAMYRDHPIRTPILGTRQTIRQITPQVLQQCHSAFYQPANMLLCVVGDVDPARVRAIAENRLGSISCPRLDVRRSWQENMTVVTPFVSDRMEVAMPTFQLGFKCEPMDRGEAAVRAEIVADLACEALFGESSALYLRLYEEGLIDSSFGGGFETIEGMALLTASGDSEQPEAIRDAILAEAARIARQGLPEADFLRMKRSALGRRIRGLDSFDSTCFRLCAYHFSGFDYFSFPALYEQITVSDIQEFLQRVVTGSRCALCVIYPNEEA